MADKYRRGRDIKAAPTQTVNLRQKGPAPVRGLLIFLSVLVLGLSGAGYYVAGNTFSKGPTIGGDKSTFGQAADGATDILLVGSDSRSDAEGNALTPDEINMLRAGDEENDNTDTIMVIRIPNDGSSATAVSIPRDTYIHDAKNGNMKINGVYGTYKNERKAELSQKGGIEGAKLEEESKNAGRKALMDTVSNLSGIKIEHYAEVGLLGFVLLTDAVGGVDVCLNEAVDDEFSGAKFKAGRQTLNGPDALSFVRQRHGLPRGDLDRVVRQQVFMASIVNKVLSSGTLSSPSKFADLSEAVRRSVKLDANLDPAQFAMQMQNLAGGNVQFSTIPVTSIDGVGDYGESVVTINTKDVNKFFQTLLGEKSEPSSSAPPSDNPKQALLDATRNTSINVLNATQTSGLAAAVAGALGDMGLKIDQVTNAEPGLYNQTTIVASRADDPAAIALAGELGGLPIQASNSLNANEVAVVVGSDYDGPKSNSPITESPEEVGQAGSDKSSDAAKSPNIDAGGDGPRCVN
ncbi:LCP family protein [Corynebacterium durum]|uniref:LCP family protein n=1 Tax=Corynebacterium durum TaxID=61592 RepID=UPI0015CC4BEC|nr:LCP family protein [Corynebacterium durum]NYI75219.1 LCP family protein required for cell wall assembly [Corynebacterium durum]WJY84352.1 Transcriptional regulator LytR [Corynebacterium durum]